jgi:hypothetical protein
LLRQRPPIRVRELPPEVSQKSRPRAATDSLDLQEHERVMIERGWSAAVAIGQAAQALKISTVTL